MPPLPPFTKWLMLALAAVFLIDELTGKALSMWLALWPLNSGNFYPWQLVTYAVVQSSISQLLFVVLGLWMFGAELERLWGHQRYWQLLLASVVAAAAVYLLLSFAFGALFAARGASGALYGLLMAYALVFPRRQFDLIGFLPMVLMMIPSQIFYTIGIVLFVLLWTNRQAVPLRPVLVPAMTMVMIFGAIALISAQLYGLSIAELASLGGMLGAWLCLQYWRRRVRGGSRTRH